METWASIRRSAVGAGAEQLDPWPDGEQLAPGGAHCRCPEQELTLRWISAIAILLCITPAGAQNIGMGEELFGRCAMCHEVGPEAKNRQGPHLNEVLGRRAGSVTLRNVRHRLAPSICAASSWRRSRCDQSPPTVRTTTA